MMRPSNIATTHAAARRAAGAAALAGLLASAQPASASSWSNGGTWMWLNPTGDRVGIGLSGNPAEKLQVAGGNVLIDNARQYRARTTSGTSTALLGLNGSNHAELYGTRMVVQSGGNVGIGTPTPSTKLHVNGDVTGTNFWGSNMIATFGHFESLTIPNANYNFQSWAPLMVYNWVSINGDLDVWGSKNFSHPHPEDEAKRIVYVAAEAGEALTLARGTAKTSGGSVKVRLPEHFSLVTSDEAPVSVLLTVKRVPALAFVASESDKEFEVRLKDSDFAEFKDVEFNWQVQGVRDGFEDHAPIQDVAAAPSPSRKRLAHDAKVKTLVERQAAARKRN